MEPRPEFRDNPPGVLPPGWGGRLPWLGPAVWVSSVLYFVAQVVVARGWHPPYSFARNSISALGDTGCGPFDGHFVCSPRHALMNAAFVFLGVVMVVGAALIRRMVGGRVRVGVGVGFGGVAVGGLGVVLVGLAPENRAGGLHVLGAFLAIVVAHLGIFVLGCSLGLPGALRRAMVVGPPVCLAAILLFALRQDLGLGLGTMERIGAYPVTLWLIGFGLYLLWALRHGRREPLRTP